MNERYFLWSDGDGHEYCVPVSLKNKVDELEGLHPIHNCDSEDQYWQKWDTIFNQIEHNLIRVEGLLTFENPQTTE